MFVVHLKMKEKPMINKINVKHMNDMLNVLYKILNECTYLAGIDTLCAPIKLTVMQHAISYQNKYTKLSQLLDYIVHHLCTHADSLPEAELHLSGQSTSIYRNIK